MKLILNLLSKCYIIFYFQYIFIFSSESSVICIGQGLTILYFFPLEALVPQQYEFNIPR